MLLNWYQFFKIKRFLFGGLLFFLLTQWAYSDVVKPALIEVSIFADKQLELLIDLSLEAVMTGIGTQYKNTTDAPNSADYDALRALKSSALEDKFSAFSAEFKRSMRLMIDNKLIDLTLIDTQIDIKGYTKRPRKSVLRYAAKLHTLPTTISWQYAKIYGDSAWRYRFFKKDSYTWQPWQWLSDGQFSGVINLNSAAVQSIRERFLQFVSIGFLHVIKQGWDHILFIIGIALSSLLWRQLLLLVSAFTLAHTLTLGLAMFGILVVPERIVEPLIALSIAYIAIENLLLKPSFVRKSVLVFCFGLLHGLGFANLLSRLQMNDSNFLTTLIGFNIGVELAQIVIVASVFLLLLSLQKTQFNYQKWLVIPILVMIAMIGISWSIDRII